MTNLYNNLPSSKFIESYLDTRLYDVLYPSLYNISVILGDTEGKVGINTATFLTKDINYTENGSVFLNVLNDYEETEEGSSVEETYRSTEYIPHYTKGVVPMSPDIYGDSEVKVFDINDKMPLKDATSPLRFTVSKIKTNNNVVIDVFSGTMTAQGFKALVACDTKAEILVDHYNLGELNSPLLTRAIRCLGENSNTLLAVKVTYMELLALFVTLSKTNKDLGVNTISIEDLSLISRNLYTIADYVSYLPDAWEVAELTEVLRDAYRAVKTITLSKNLFKETYAVRYHDVYSGGVRI